MTKSADQPVAPAKAAEARDDPHLKEFVAHAQKVAAQLADETKDALKEQARIEKVQDEMRKGAAKTRQAEK